MIQMLMTLKDVTQRFGNHMILTSDLHLSSSSSHILCQMHVKGKDKNPDWALGKEKYTRNKLTYYILYMVH